MSGRQRLDVAIQVRGLLPSRARARDAILRGAVTVNGALTAKPGLLVGDDDAIGLDDPAAGYVSRAALKLIAGLDAGAIGVAGKVCLDLGLSTGGFTQVLLERGAKRVYGIDVGHGQVHRDIAGDPRVVVLEGVNARDVSRDQVPEPIHLIVCDVSFVSATKVLAAPLALCAAGAEAVILIKPQFEVGREQVGKGGIVSDPAAIERAATDVVTFMVQRRWRHLVSIPSPIAGGDGNTEIVAVFQRLNGL
jgi:23S rRNA (cytidine1920-2'-O)/16S rRNA (cytidine1409-2'-O)-methyltransferase